MTPQKSGFALLPAALLTLVLAAACVTVNIYFPAAQVERTAETIVGEVYGQPPGEAAPEETSPAREQPAPGPSSALSRILTAAADLLGPAPAWAQQETSVSNATIRGLKDQLAANHRQLVPFYEAGNVGITTAGYLDIRSTQGLSVQQVAQVRRLVAADNQARKSLYQEVAKALQIAPSELPRVERIFGAKWQQDARPGWWVESGGWVRK